MISPAPRIAGLAACCALGPDAQTLWQNLREGVCGLTQQSVEGSGTVLGVMPHPDWEGEGDPWADHVARVGRAAIRDAGEDPSRVLGHPSTGLVIATTKGDIEGLRRPGRPESLGPFLRRIRRALGHQGPAELVSAACASGSAALVRAVRLLQGSCCRRVLVIGADRLDSFLVEGFRCLGAMADGPCRPYDDTRMGLSLGEAVAALWLDGERGAGVRLTGVGQSQDAVGMVRPDPEGTGLARAIGRALREAGAGPVRAVCGHGTATEANDAMEAAAFRRVFGSACPPVFGVKGATGHTLGACGTLEALICVQAIREGCIPPTTGHRSGSLGIPVTTAPQALPEGRILSVNSGFGGINVALVLEAGP